MKSLERIIIVCIKDRYLWVVTENHILYENIFCGRKNEDKKNERGIKGMRYADMPPYAPTLMESTRAIGYSIEAAIADIIDNSVAATAGKIDIDFFPIGHSYISILDDGHGMSEEELIIAMQYGSRSPLDERAENDLGRYGLGMKTASLSQCRILTVISKKDGKVSGAQWNLNHIRQAESWSLIVLEEDEIVGFPNWEKLNGDIVNIGLHFFLKNVRPYAASCSEA